MSTKTPLSVELLDGLLERGSEIIGSDILKYKTLIEIIDAAYEAGCKIGYEAGTEQIKELFNESHVTPLDAGTELEKAKGFAEGYRDGMVEGEKAGFDKGYKKGRDAGLAEAIEVINSQRIVFVK
jgi:flagellar biosynthesis/type III secretory pathway protein FliH